MLRFRALLVLLVTLPLVVACSDDPPPSASPTATAAPTAIVTPSPAVPPVVFIGDSVTWGAFASTPDDVFVARVHSHLKTGNDTYSTSDVVWTMDPYNDLINIREVASEHRRLIVVELGVHWAGFGEAHFREIYGDILDCLAGSDAILVVGTIPWLNWSLDSPLYSEMASYSRIIREEAAKRHIAVADLWAVTDQRADAISRPGQPCYMGPGCQGDNYHPGDLGHALIAEAYIAALDAALANPPRATDGSCDFDDYLRVFASVAP